MEQLSNTIVILVAFSLISLIEGYHDIARLKPYLNRKYRFSHHAKDFDKFFTEATKRLKDVPEILMSVKSIEPTFEFAKEKGEYLFKIAMDEGKEDYLLDTYQPLVFKIGKEFETRTADGELVSGRIVQDNNKLLFTWGRGDRGKVVGEFSGDQFTIYWHIGLASSKTIYKQVVSLDSEM